MKYTEMSLLNIIKERHLDEAIKIVINDVSLIIREIL